MFLANSRYVHVATVDTRTATGEAVRALKLRRLTPVVGDARTVAARIVQEAVTAQALPDFITAPAYDVLNALD